MSWPWNPLQCCNQCNFIGLLLQMCINTVYVQIIKLEKFLDLLCYDYDSCNIALTHQKKGHILFKQDSAVFTITSVLETTQRFGRLKTLSVIMCLP